MGYRLFSEFNQLHQLWYHLFFFYCSLFLFLFLLFFSLFFFPFPFNSLLQQTNGVKSEKASVQKKSLHISIKMLVHRYWERLCICFNNIKIDTYFPLPLKPWQMINVWTQQKKCYIIYLTSCSCFSLNFRSSSSVFFRNLSWAIASLSNHRRCWVSLKLNVCDCCL